MNDDDQDAVQAWHTSEWLTTSCVGYLHDELSAWALLELQKRSINA